jgi:putative ABC transport system permease protein
MIENYFKIILRIFRKNKIYSVINVAGLAIGLACFMLIVSFIKNDLSYDNFHEHADRIFRPVEIQQHAGVGTQHVAVTMGPLAQALREEFPQIISAARIVPFGTFFCQMGEKGFYEQDVAYADPQLFDIFSIPFISGESRTSLEKPHSMVIDAELAKKYFGDEEAVGQTITLHHPRGVNDYTVTGVMQTYPKNSHLRFRILCSFVSIEDQLPYLKNWNSNSLATYVLLRDANLKDELEKAFPEFLQKYVAEGFNAQIEIYLQPLRDIHLHSSHIVYQTFNNNQGSINTVYTFSAIAIFVLIIACINFMNLSTARSAKRAKEIGMRKVLGSDRRSLIYQFIGEAIFFAVLAFVLSLALVQLAYSLLRPIFETRIIFDYTTDVAFLLQMMGVALLVGLVAGSYPALYLSSFAPAHTLKGPASSQARGAGLRRSLVLVQFAIAITLIVCTGIVHDQMEFIRKKDLGFNKDQVVYLPIRSREISEKLPLLKSDLKKDANVINVSASAGLRGASGSQGTMQVAGSNGEIELMMRFSYVDFDFLNTMEMQLVDGRDFSESIASDTATSVIINETAVRELGWQQPVGQHFQRGHNQPLTVIGVVKDFHFYTMHQKIEPLLMSIAPQQLRYLLVKIQPHDLKATIAFIEEVWNRHLPGRPFEYDFLDDHFKEIYRSDENLGRLFAAFSLTAIFIACLGLFGLASFTAEQKTKEIGIRKVLGASVTGMIFLLAKDFTKWVAIASLIAFPIAYFTIQDWLSNFVYRTEIHFYTFLLAAAIVVVIALLTVSFQAIKAAVANPVESLRYE